MLNLNTNLIHNILNLLIVALPAVLIGTGCTQLLNGDLDCSASWLDPTYTLWGVAALGIAKFALNFLRDGIGGLWKAQSPVRSDATLTSVGVKPTPAEKDAVKEAQKK